MNDIKISIAESTDFDQIVCLLGEITESIKTKKGWGSYNVASHIADQKKIFSDILKSNSKIFIARKGDKILGVANMQTVMNIRHGFIRAHLEEVVVDNSFRKEGIGSKLISAIVEYCKNNKIQVIKLMCGRQLDYSLKFYKKNGFEFTDEGLRLEVKR